jgi:nucleoside-diphosphate-sugar epimerase
VKRIVVIGGTGFLGRCVVERLVRRGDRVLAVGRTRQHASVPSVQADLSDADDAHRLFSSSQWDAIVNLAGPVTGGIEDLDTGIDVVAKHVRVALNVLRYGAHARIVHASSMTVYGHPTARDVDETHPRRPHHLYGLAKMLAEDVLLSDPDSDVWILRLPGLFAAERRDGALYHFCRAARAGEPIRVTATVPTAWNILHVADAADAIVCAMDAPKRRGLALNVAYDVPVQIVEVARAIATMASPPVEVEYRPDIVHPAMRMVCERARDALAWSPPALETRLREIYEAYATT